MTMFPGLNEHPTRPRASVSSFNWLGNQDPAFNSRVWEQQGVHQLISCLQRPETCIKLPTAEMKKNNTRSLCETALDVNHINSPVGCAQQQRVMEWFSQTHQWRISAGQLCCDLVINVMFYRCPVELKSSIRLNLNTYSTVCFNIH